MSDCPYHNRVRGAREAGWKCIDFTAPRVQQSKTCEIDAEDSYRRGYYHGYSRAMDDWRGVSARGYDRTREVFSLLARFFDGALRSWRYAAHKGFALPPTIVFPEAWAALRKQVIQRDERCVACGSADRLQVDHILAVAHGGMPDAENLQALCFECHSEKTRDMMRAA